MKFKDMVQMALSNLFKRKVRTILTVIGVVVGTCAIVVMLSLGIGIQETSEAMMNSMGDLTVIQINNYSPKPDCPALNDNLLKKITEIEKVVAVTPVYFGNQSSFSIKSRKYSYEGTIYGVYMDQFKALGYKAEKGNLPSENFKKTDVLFGKNSEYSFIDSSKMNSFRLMPQPDKNGKMPKPKVEPSKDKLEAIIDVPEDSNSRPKPIKLNYLGSLAEDWGKNPQTNNCIYMDVRFLKELEAKADKLNKTKNKPTDTNVYESAIIKVAEVKDVPEIEKQIKDMGFETYSMETMRKPMEDQMRNIQLILGGLGAISLFVAALGITNTMIMSIYERTREIGIMKVLGCVIRNIRTMFLIEAGAIGFLGGIIGIAQSYGISFIINTIAQNANSDPSGGMGMAAAAGSQAPVNISIIPLWLAAGAVIFSTLIGLISGFYPANRAVKISALTAIKQE